MIQVTKYRYCRFEGNAVLYPKSRNKNYCQISGCNLIWIYMHSYLVTGSSYKVLCVDPDSQEFKPFYHI
jgi:hypothetical protein